MTADSTNRQLVWLTLTIVAIFVVLPVFAMGFWVMGAEPMMGGMWSDGMWGAGGAAGWMLGGVVMQLLFLALVVGAVYFGYRTLTTRDEAADPALTELWTAYARGELSDEEYERRRNRLESES